jgi:hypothetical protein
MKMEIIRYEIILQAMQPIAHHECSFGNAAVAMRRKIALDDGTFVEIPIVTADAMRHGCREASSYATLDAAGLMGDIKLEEGALRLLFSGGMITGKGDASAIKLDTYREMIDVVPALALFGGCAGNRSIPGRLNVDDATLICEEYEPFLPAWVKEWLAAKGYHLNSCRAHLEEVQRVRGDALLDPGKRALLSDGARAIAEQRLLASAEAHDADDPAKAAASKSTMLPRRFERIAQGSFLIWGIEATCYSELDRDTFDTTMASFLSLAKVGGKKATGHGLVRAVAGRKETLVSASERSVEVCALAFRVGQIFRAHVMDRSERLRAFLGAVDA